MGSCCWMRSASATTRSITGVFLVVGVTVMLINLVVDLSYGLLDPKVSHR
jgi:ABC-type dipeptide/oligopeptide/nickel transport system permease component